MQRYSPAPWSPLQKGLTFLTVEGGLYVGAFYLLVVSGGADRAAGASAPSTFFVDSQGCILLMREELLVLVVGAVASCGVLVSLTLIVKLFGG